MDKDLSEDDPKESVESSKNQNITKGKQNTFEDVGEIHVEGSVELKHEVNQTADESTKEVPIQDPANLNGRVALYQGLLRYLPIPQQHVNLAFGGSGLLGGLGIVLYVLCSLPSSNQYSLPLSLPTEIAVVATLLAILGFGYFSSRQESFCDECGTPFALETTDTVKYPELSDDEVVRGRRKRECQHCGYSEVEDTKEWDTEKLK